MSFIGRKLTVPYFCTILTKIESLDAIVLLNDGKFVHQHHYDPLEILGNNDWSYIQLKLFWKLSEFQRLIHLFDVIYLQLDSH